MIHPQVFERLCGLHMADDPSTSSRTVDNACNKWLDEQAFELGYSSWIEGYHSIEHEPPEVKAPTLRDGPHSRACGPAKHDHGRACHRNCPTCSGGRRTD